MKEESEQKFLFEKEIEKLPPQIKSKLKSKEKAFKAVVDAINANSKGKSMGFYLSPQMEIKNNVPQPNFDKLTLNFLLDDFEKPIPFFDPRIILKDKFDKFLVEERKRDGYDHEYFEYTLKSDKNVKFFGTSISIIRENCFDGIYDDLKRLGTSFIFEDSRGFISALKTIDIHRNMLLQKFEKYVVVYAGAGSWLRGEKSNDFDVFVVIDDTDVKRMPRFQVKDQLTKIIWQMAREVSALTGINIHIQVYLLTDFWDALKDAHPVMFTFLRDGVPFYDRGIYSAWKELLKLGKIRPSPEAIDMHMNVGTQLIERAKKIFTDIVVNDIYSAVLSPSQAILMLKGFNPTTPKETVRMFKSVLLEKEKIVSKKDVDTLEETIGLFKKIEHDKSFEIKGKDLDRLIKNSEDYLKNIKKIFEEISESRTKESVSTSYNELIKQLADLPGYSGLSESDLFEKFREDYVQTGKVSVFTKTALKDIIKAKADYDEGKITVTEVNKVLKELRNVMSEIKNLRESNALLETNRKKLNLVYDGKKQAEILSYDDKIYLIDYANDLVYEYKREGFTNSEQSKDSFSDVSKVNSLKLTGRLFDSAKDVLNAKELHL